MVYKIKMNPKHFWYKNKLHSTNLIKEPSKMIPWNLKLSNTDHCYTLEISFDEFLGKITPRDFSIH